MRRVWVENIAVIIEKVHSSIIEPHLETNRLFAYAKTKTQISFAVTWFVSDLVGNPEDRFSHNEAHLVSSVPLPA